MLIALIDIWFHNSIFLKPRLYTSLLYDDGLLKMHFAKYLYLAIAIPAPIW